MLSFKLVTLALVLSILVLGCVAGGGHGHGHGGGHGHGNPVKPIKLVRNLPVGTQVKVRGVVNFPNNIQDGGFGIQDSTAGIYVSDAQGTDRKVGDYVEVVGTVAINEPNAVPDLLQIKVSSIKVLGTRRAPRPEKAKTGRINLKNQGELVEVSGRVSAPTFDDSPWGFKVYINDGSGQLTLYLNAATGIDSSNVEVGDYVKAVGLSSQYGSEFEVWPRNSADFRLFKNNNN